MRIAFFSDFYLPVVSGIATSMQLLAQGLRAAGHDITIFAPRFPNYEDDEPKVRRVPSFRYSTRPEVYVALPGTPRTTWALRTSRFDLIHTHSPLTVGMMAFVTARAKRLPLVYTYHTSITDYTHYMKMGSESRLARRLARWFSASTANLSDQIVVPSKKFQRVLEEQNVQTPIHTIPNGIELSIFQTPAAHGLYRQRLGLAPDTPLLLYMGRLDPEKRMEVLLEAFVHLAKRNARAHLVFAGDGSTRPALEVQAETTEFRSRIHFLGMVPRSDLPNLLHDADLFITASTSEVHPISMIEAIASGLPVVAVKDDAYDGLLEDGVNGRATARDAQSIGDAILDLLNHPETLAQYRQASAELSRKFSIEAQVNSLIRLYRTTIEAVKNNS